MQNVNLFLSINEWCNLDCSYCNVVKTHKQLSFEDCKKAYIYFIKFFPDASWYNIFFIGWEPMLSYKEIHKSILFLQVLSEKIGKPIATHMPTNGTLLNDRNLSFFKKYNHQISLSIDSLDPNYIERSLRWEEWKSSVPFLLQKIDLFQKFSDILRVKIVVVPQLSEKLLPTFLYLRKLWFQFINIQPAHGVFWSIEEQNIYIQNILKTKFISQGIENLKSTTFKWSNRDECDGPTKTSCAKWKSEICIDSYGNIMVCDAFLAYNPEKRKQYAHDNLYTSSFDNKKFQEYSDWKYCNNTILWDEKDLTKCKTCDEVKSCSTLCNAIPINGKEYDHNILLSNFSLSHRLNKLWI